MHLDRLRAAGLTLAVLGWNACQVVPQPTWSPDPENSRASHIAATPTPTVPRPKSTHSNRYSDDQRSSIQGGARTISFEQDGEVYTVGWVYLPRTGKSYHVLQLTSQIPGTVQVEMLWDRSVDDFALEVEDSAGTMVKATRTGLKESTLVFLPRGRRASVYMTRFSSENVAPKLVMRFSAGSAIPQDPPQYISAEYRESEDTPTPDMRFAVLDLPKPPPEDDDEDVPPAPVSVEREPTAQPGWTSSRSRPSPVSKPKPESDAPARKPAASPSRKASEPAVRKAPVKPVPAPAAVPTARPRTATASSSTAPASSAPSSATVLPAVARATIQPTQQVATAPTPVPGTADAEVAKNAQEDPDEDESVQVGEPRKGAKISPRGEATNLPLALNAGTFAGSEELVLEIPQARLEITVPRGFDVTVRDDRDRSVSLSKVKLFDSWEGIGGTDASFLSDSFSTPPLPSGHYVVETHGRFEDVRLRTKTGVTADRDAVLKQSSRLVLIKRQNG